MKEAGAGLERDRQREGEREQRVVRRRQFARREDNSGSGRRGDEARTRGLADHPLLQRSDRLCASKHPRPSRTGRQHSLTRVPPAWRHGRADDGAAYEKKTSKAMCDELGDLEYMRAYVEEQGEGKAPAGGGKDDL